MFKIQTMNNIAEAGLEVLEKRGCEVGPETVDPNGILLRSAGLHGMAFGDARLALPRAAPQRPGRAERRCAAGRRRDRLSRGRPRSRAF